MASLAASTLSSRPAVCQRPARRCSVVCSARPQDKREQPQVNRIAQVAAAGLAAMYLAAAPAMAASNNELKAKLCASLPTAKICLKDSAKK